MKKNKLILIVVIGLFLATGIAVIGDFLKERSGRKSQDTTLKCAYDGTKLNPLYQVEAFLNDGSSLSFCSIYCAAQWYKNQQDWVVYLTVIDETSGRKFDSSLGIFVESDLITVPEVKNCIHAFYLKSDALKHAQQFNGRLIENPFGFAFVPPDYARLDRLIIGTPALPDAVPLKAAIFKPIFKEKMLDVKLVPVETDDQTKNLLKKGAIDGFICDLPAALVFAQGSPPVSIVKNVLRANPYRALYALVTQPGSDIDDFARMEHQRIAVPKGVSFQFYARLYLNTLDALQKKITIRPVENVAAAWDLLRVGEVSAAVLRTPYTDMAAAENMPFLADDRTLPWMSVLVLTQSVIKDKPEVVEKFMLALEQSVLALNLKPDDYRLVLEQQAGIPQSARKNFPMPIFEGANGPSAEEIQPILQWLVNSHYLDQPADYRQLVNLQYLPDPENVGLAYCCR